MASLALAVACHRNSESSVWEMIERRMKEAEAFTKLPPATQRAQLHQILDRAKDENDGIHDACGDLRYVGDVSSVPHIIRALRFFPDEEIAGTGRGIVCTQQHCVDVLRKLTGVDVGVSYTSWQKWWEETRPN